MPSGRPFATTSRGASTVVSDAPRPSAICDAGPLIHLGEIGAARLLPQFHPLLVPASVWAEAVSFRPPTDFAWEITAVGEADRRALEGRLVTQLDPGEADCLALCSRHPGAIFLTDDLAARRAPQRLGITVHGSVGIIVRSFRVGLLTRPEADTALVALRDCRSLFVTKVIIDLAREELADAPPI